jgi:hypothetical protein
MEYKTGVEQIVPDGYEPVFEDIYSVLPLMCITCEEVGVNNFVASIGSKPVCVTNPDSVKGGCANLGLTSSAADTKAEVDTGVVIGVIIACLVLMVLTGFGIYTVWKRAIKEEEVALKHNREEAEREQAQDAATSGAPVDSSANNGGVSMV